MDLDRYRMGQGGWAKSMKIVEQGQNWNLNRGRGQKTGI